jgi:hypothetical protein
MKMTVIYILISVLIPTIFLISCSTSKNIKSIKPEPTISPRVIQNSKISYIGMPLEIGLKDLEKQMNSILSGLIYEDSIIEDDNILLKMWKTNDIKITEKEEKIFSEIPVKIWMKFKYGTEFLGLNDTRVLNLEGIFYFKSDVALKNWKMTTNSELLDYKWKSSPTIEIGGKKVAITYILNPAINIFKNKLSNKIDLAISEMADYKAYVIEALDTLSKPYLINDQYEVWLKINPLELYSTQAYLKNNKVVLGLALKCSLLTVIGSQPLPGFDKNKLKIQNIDKITDKFEAFLAGVATYKDASRIITNNFKDAEFKSNGAKIKILNVEMWYKEEKVVLALTVSGSLKGTIYLTGKPKYDSEKSLIYFDDLQYIVDTKNILSKFADWMLGDIILNKINSYCTISICENLDQAKKEMMNYFNNYSPMAGVYVNGTVTTLDFENIEIGNDAIIAFLKVVGKVNIKVDGL